MMRLQMSLEILFGMLVSLLVALALLGYFSGAHSLLSSTQETLSGAANAADSYLARMLVR